MHFNNDKAYNALVFKLEDKKMTLQEWLTVNDITQTQFAEMISADTPDEPLKQASVTYWLQKEVPAGRMAQVERITKGSVSMQEAAPSRFK